MNNKNHINSLTSPLNKDSVVVMVIERIKEALINKELKPGDYLPSGAELSKNLGVGNSSIREAIKMLQALGVVEVIRGRGTIIRKHPKEDIIDPLMFQLIMEKANTKDILDFRILFEPGSTIMAMKRATKKDIEKIEKTVDNFETAIKNGTQKAEDDIAFHSAILQSTYNPFVIKIGETILQLYKASISKSMKNIPEIALKDHKKILNAFCEKNEKKLRDAVIKSFDGWKKSLYGE